MADNIVQNMIAGLQQIGNEQNELTQENEQLKLEIQSKDKTITDDQKKLQELQDQLDQVTSHLTDSQEKLQNISRILAGEAFVSSDVNPKVESPVEQPVEETPKVESPVEEDPKAESHEEFEVDEKDPNYNELLNKLDVQSSESEDQIETKSDENTSEVESPVEAEPVEVEDKKSDLMDNFNGMTAEDLINTIPDDPNTHSPEVNDNDPFAGGGLAEIVKNALG